MINDTTYVSDITRVELIDTLSNDKFNLRESVINSVIGLLGLIQFQSVSIGL